LLLAESYDKGKDEFRLRDGARDGILRKFGNHEPIKKNIKHFYRDDKGCDYEGAASRQESFHGGA
jgi:hypothetical protein